MTNYLYEVRKSRNNLFFKYYITRMDEAEHGYGKIETLTDGFIFGPSWWNSAWDMEHASYYLTQKDAEKALFRYLKRIDATLQKIEATNPKYDERLVQVKIDGKKILIDKFANRIYK